MAMASLNMHTVVPKTLSARVQSNLGSSRAVPTVGGRGSLVVTAASKKKDVRLTITLECTEQKASGVAGMSRYMSQKVRLAKLKAELAGRLDASK